ncbi:acetate--CoA ligase family protein [Sedimentibacter sp.]|uniref:acetate--CoA ligase family protein n=1 Tax=Sedimentibacter sp. TaxID=1960295 RepID=UPI0028AE0AD9|nr:acetate--CoA ligase family protein [Sedimentibacter sp.]
MSMMNLNKLIKPSTVAIVGASESAGFGGDTTKNYLKFSENLDKLYLINPKRETIFGHKAYKSLLEVEGDIDLVIICTPQSTIIPLLREASEKNCGGAVVFASGYSEVGEEGRIKQQELIEEADRLGIAVMGPNCAGFANYINGIFAFAFLVEERERKGNIGFISQSGQIILSGLDSPNMGFSYCISSGNSCNVKVEDYLDFLVDDEDTKVVAAYMEGVTKPAQLIETLKKAANKKKPIIILKTGKSDKSQQLAASHTGSLSGSDKVLRAVFKHYGVIEADDLEELCGAAAAFSWIDKLPEGGKTVFMNVSGGEAGVTADLADEFGIELAEYKQETKEYLMSLLPEYGSVNNPFDMTAGIGYNTPVLCEAIRTISKDENVDAICLAYTITPEIWDDTIAHMVEAVKITREEGNIKPVFWMPFIEHTRHLESANTLKDAGVPLLPTGKYACEIMKKIFDFSVFEFEDLGAAIPENVHNNTFALSEYESLCYLRDKGVNVPAMEVALTPEEAVVKAESLSYPLSVKVNSRDIMHKSDVGGVKLNIKNEEGLNKAFEDIIDSCSSKVPGAKIEGVLLKPMLEPGVEMIIGVNNDKDFGPTIMIGMGGVFVELFKDVQLSPAPLTKSKAMSMIQKLKAYPLLNGYRGSKVCNTDALAELLVKISEVAANGKDTIKEMDINPVFVTEKGVSIADGLLIVYED